MCSDVGNSVLIKQKGFPSNEVVLDKLKDCKIPVNIEHVNKKRRSERTDWFDMTDGQYSMTYFNFQIPYVHTYIDIRNGC